MYAELPKRVLGRARKCELWKVTGNPFLRPPATVVDIGVEDALSWWADVERFGEGKSNKLKMVLVGLAEAGKTTLVRHFTDNPGVIDLERTVGIEITPDWRPSESESLQVNIWDFAGQADYYSSHQLFLTKGSLFILVVDLDKFADELSNGPDNFTDPNRRVYWWLEMLYMRVPGAAVVLVGSHVDLLENADDVSRDLLTVVQKFIDVKEKKSSEVQTTTKPLIVHQRVFKVSRDPESVLMLRKWIPKAASGEDCPVGFYFPAVNQSLPKPWIDAFSAMEDLGNNKPFVLWSKAVEVFKNVCTSETLQEAGDLLLRAMKHREAEGGVLLSLSDLSEPKEDDMLHLDPTWLVELVRRLADHNLVETEAQDDIQIELQEYTELKGVDLGPLWKTHSDYVMYGKLDEDYLWFLWTHHKIDSQSQAVNLGKDEFKSIVTAMTRLLVMYRSRTSDHEFVVPARLPEYGHRRVTTSVITGDIVTTKKASFGQVYPPPGIVGRFLAWFIDKIAGVVHCWQHGAFFIYRYKSRRVDAFVYESDDDLIKDGKLQRRYSGLTVGVQGEREQARSTLEALGASVEEFVRDRVHGYPGLCTSFIFKTRTEKSGSLSDVISEIEALAGRLEKAVSSVEKSALTLGGIVRNLKETLFAASETFSEYPRLVILEPEESVKNEEREQQWIGWKEAWGKLRFPDVSLRHKFRLRFVCEHDLTEVPCGPDGRGYRLDKNIEELKSFIPLLKATLWVIKAAVGTVLHIDLPLGEVFEAIVSATGEELLEGLSTKMSESLLRRGNGALPVFDAESADPKIVELMGETYKSLCEFMRDVESASSHASCGCLPLRCSRPIESLKSWRDEMVRVENGSGGWAWVLKKNENAYLDERR